MSTINHNPPEIHQKSNRKHKKILTPLVIIGLLISLYKIAPTFGYLFTKHTKSTSSTAQVGGSKSISDACTHSGRPQNELAKVLRVIDGDTIEVERPCGTDKVRFIGINTPESVDPRRPVQCFGKEASHYLSTLINTDVNNKEIYIYGDQTQSERDIYNRLLGYIFIQNTSTSTTATSSQTNINLKMIQDGYAYEYTYKTPYQYQKEFKKAQKTAEREKIGLWSSSTCNGLK